MKVKLLKKLRKKYSWYFNNEKCPVLINHKTKNVIVFNLKYCMKPINYTLEDVEKTVEIDHKLWFFRVFKKHLLGKYGWTVDKNTYRIAVLRFKQKYKQ
jgi:hypothetical protein